LTIPFGGAGGSLAGYIDIKGGTFKPGCVLRITQGKTSGEDAKKTVTGRDCDDYSKAVSASVSFDVSGLCGNSNFEHLVTVQMYSRLVKDSDSCFGFTEDDVGSPWECLRSKKVQNLKDNILWQTETNHFTYENQATVWSLNICLLL